MTSTKQCLRASIVFASGLLLAGTFIGGCAGEAEGPDDLDDADFTTLSEDVVSNPLTPVLTCMDDLGSNNYKAHFGYNNTSSRSVRVPVGALNFFVPLPKSQGQPIDFAAGNHPDVFQVKFSTRDGWDRLAWWLSGRRALATRRTPICAPPPPPPPPQCTTAAQCDDEDPCTTNTCVAGRCNTAPATQGTACSHGDICDGAGRCVQCTADAQCDDERSCSTDRCVNNLCSYSPAPVGTRCGRTGSSCDAAGVCQPPSPSCLGDADCNDEDPCTTDVCNLSTLVCGHSAAPVNTACSHGDICDGAGRCVQCTSDAQCDDERSCTTDRCVNNLCSYSSAPAGTSCGRTGQACNATGACI